MYCVLLEETNSGCIIEGGLLPQVQTHTMDRLILLQPVNISLLVLVVSHYYEAEADYVQTMAHSKQFFLSRSNVLAVVILCMYSSYYSCIIILTSVGAPRGYCLDQVTESMLVMLVSLTTMPTPNGRCV